MKRTAVSPVLALSDQRVVDVACGDKFTVVICQSPNSLEVKKDLTAKRKKWFKQSGGFMKEMMNMGL